MTQSEGTVTRIVGVNDHSSRFQGDAPNIIADRVSFPQLAVVVSSLQVSQQSIKFYSAAELKKYVHALGLRLGQIYCEELPDGTTLVGRKDNGEYLITTPEVLLPSPISHNDAMKMPTAMAQQQIYSHGYEDWRSPKADFPARRGCEGESAMLFRARNSGKLQGIFKENRLSSSCVWILGQADARFFVYLNFYQGQHQITYGNTKHIGLPVRTFAP